MSKNIFRAVPPDSGDRSKLSKIIKRKSATVFMVVLLLPLGGATFWQTTGDFAVNAADKNQQTVFGIFTVAWSDPLPGSGLLERADFSLITAAGETIALVVPEAEIEAAGGIRHLLGKAVKVTGAEKKGAVRSSSFTVASIALDGSNLKGDESSLAQIGNKKFVNILCKFADQPNEPRSPSYFDQMFGSSYPGLDHYWREVSYNQMNVAGSVTVGWYTLPYNYSHYLPASGFDYANFTRDCAMQADAAIYFPDFYGINFIGNVTLEGGVLGRGGPNQPLSLDGGVRTYGMTWLSPAGYRWESVVAHEMGHSFGLQHSSGPYGSEYDSAWDVLSWYTISPYEPTFGYIPQNTISSHKDFLGWIPAEQKFVPAAAERRLITLTPLENPPSASGRRTYQMAQIPIYGTDQFYTVEARNLIGYDAPLPAKAVVIHKVGTRSIVVDPDDNSDPNDAAAQWQPGETFVDAANHIAVTVESEAGGNFNVIIETNYGCTFALNTSGASFPVAGGVGTLEVNTQPGCYWSLTGAAPTIQGSATGSQIYDAPSRAPFVGVAKKYPSTISIPGVPANVTKVSVRVKALNHPAPGDLDVVLVGPEDQKVMLMSDAGGTAGITNTEYLFDTLAFGPLDEFGFNPSGIYLPTNYGVANDIFPSPGPGTGSYAANLDSFNGTNPKGDWKLYAVDDTQSNTGALGNWSLNIGITPVIAEVVSGYGSGLINYTVTRNYGAARVITLNISGQLYNVVQSGV